MTQFHFTAWPDHGVPDYATPILAFHRRVMKEHKSRKGPVMVHCRSVTDSLSPSLTLSVCLSVSLSLSLSLPLPPPPPLSLSLSLSPPSAGVGRTGTFITIDHALEQVGKGNVVDIPGVINKIRNQRMKLVQTVVSVCVCVCVFVCVGAQGSVCVCFHWKSSVVWPYINTGSCLCSDMYTTMKTSVIKYVECAV